MDILNKPIKEQIEYAKKTPGNVKGEVFNTFVPFIIEKEGEEGLKKALDETNKHGVLIELSEISPLRMYPGYMPVSLIVVSKDIFNWSDDDVFEMGYRALRISFMVKFFIKNLVSLETLFKNAPLYWKKHYDFGSLIPLELNKKEKYLKIATVGDDFHPLLCRFHAGYYKSILSLVIKSREITIKEIKCAHKGDDRHEYMLTWK